MQEISFDSPVPDVPRIQKVTKPTRFARPGISLSRPIKRHWLNVPAQQVKEGDVVADVGRIAHITVVTRAGGRQIRFENICGDATEYAAETTVKAFVVDES